MNVHIKQIILKVSQAQITMTTTLETTRDRLLKDFYAFIEGDLYQGYITHMYKTAEDFKFAVMVKLGMEKGKQMLEHMSENKLCRHKRLMDYASGSASMEYIDPILPSRVERDVGSALNLRDPNSLDLRVKDITFTVINKALADIHSELDSIYQNEPPHPEFWNL